MPEKKPYPLFAFYVTVLVLGVSFVFTMFFREPYPSLNMPSFTNSGVKDNIVPAKYFEAVYYKDGTKLWQGDMRELFRETSYLEYITNIRFAFFNETGLRTKRGNELRRKVFSVLPGGERIFDRINNWANPDFKKNKTPALKQLLYKKGESYAQNPDAVEVIQYINYHDLSEGGQIVRREKINSKIIKLSMNEVIK